jgi:hypothetical protein
MTNHEVLITARVKFFRDRFNLYMTLKGFTHREATDNLLKIQKELGDAEVTAEVDKYMPGYLHSSKMPAIETPITKNLN